MAPSPADNATCMLIRLAEGDRSAVPELMPLVYDELRRVAGGMLKAERRNHTLQPTALVHEAFVKLVGQDEARWKDRAHFAAVAAEAMRRILIDHARGVRAAKRNAPGERIALTVVPDSDAVDVAPAEVDVIELDAALRNLQALSPRQAQVVELRYFGGLTVEEAAEALGVSPRTVKGDWRVARAWLQARLTEGVS